MYSIPITELEKKDPEILEKLCPPNCEYLCPTEREQDDMKRKGRHWCNKFKTQVRHQFAHPFIYRTEECVDGKSADSV